MCMLPGLPSSRPHVWSLKGSDAALAVSWNVPVQANLLWETVTDNSETNTKNNA